MSWQCFFAPLAADCLSVLTNGWGQRKYLAAGTGGETVALVSRTDNGFRLTMGTLDGMRTGEWTSVLPTAADCTIAGIYPASDSSVFLGVYETATQAAENLAVYRLSADGGVNGCWFIHVRGTARQSVWPQLCYLVFRNRKALCPSH